MVAVVCLDDEALLDAVADRGVVAAALRCLIIIFPVFIIVIGHAMRRNTTVYVACVASCLPR